MAEVEVGNQTAYSVREDAAAEIVRRVLAAEGEDADVAVAFLDEPEIADLNERYRGYIGPTDVLSFPAAGTDDDWPEPEAAEHEFLGDVVICPAVAERNAQEDEIPLGEEVRRLLVHGTLHLLGYDHEVDEGEMRSREAVLLGQIGEPGGGLVEAEGEPRG